MDNKQRHWPQASAVTISPFWLALWAGFMALAWLLPNHYPPWSTFHLDVWAATILSLTAYWLVVRTRFKASWTAGPLVLLVLMGVVWCQFAAGLIVLAGTAWINSAYLLGFLIAWQTGMRWETSKSGQPADGLMMAIGMAAFVSVGLQFHQWLQLDRLDIWSMGGASTRPYANMGQPNQLGSLLIWGLLALLWGWLQKCIRPSIAAAGAVFLLFGLALTGSRTGWLAVILLNLAIWGWRRHWPSKKMPWVVAILTAGFFVAAFNIDVLSRILLVGDEYLLGDIVRAGSETRPAIWAMFLDAIWQQPLWGYGWGQVAMANSAAALMHSPMHIYFSHSHNLFLDLVLWCGLPLGLAVSGFLVWWLVTRALRVRDGRDATLMLVLLMVGNHAMLELPLHHAYFLLPVGVFMGALEVRLGVKPIWTSSRWLIGVILLASTALLALIVRDYARVEPAYQNLRFEWARIKTPPTQPPDVLLLTQWRDFVRMVRLDQQKDLSGADIQWMQDIARMFPSPGFFQLTAIALAQKGQPAQAARELATMCSMAREGQCAAVQSRWRALAETDPILAAVPWPPAPIPSR